MTQQEKINASKAVGKRRYLIIDNNNEEYCVASMLHHAIDDAKKCNGEIWLAGRCVVPSWNVR